MLNLNDIISYGNAKFQLVKSATSKDIERILEKLNAIKIIRKNNTLYSVNDVVFTEKIYSGLFLQCTVAGTSGNNELNLTNKKDGDTITDGTVVWTLHGLLNKGSSINVGEVSNVTVTPNFGKVSLTWEDPSDLVVSGVTIARWAGTRIIRKAGSAPTNKNDGELVLESLVKNKYQNSVFEDTGLEDGVTYYYGFFPYTYDGIFSQCSENYYATVPVRPKATLTLDKNTLTYSMVGDTITITAMTNSSGAITAVSSDTTKATVGVQGTVITVSCLSVGEATITISQAADSSYQSPDSITLNYSGYNDCGLILSKNSITLDASNLTDTITITRTGDGAISAVSSDTSIATVSLSGNTITVTAVANGSVTVTVSVAAGTNWLAPSDATASVAVSLIPNVLNDATWAQISQVARAGTGDTYWDVGDCKEITLNGRIGYYYATGAIDLHDYSTYVYILDFNHTEGTNGNLNGNHIVFGGFKTALTGGKDVALMGLYLKDETKKGGWKQCYLRHYGLGNALEADSTSTNISSPIGDSFMSAIPSDLRNVIKLRTHWTDNGSEYNEYSHVSAVVDVCSLLTLTEVIDDPYSTLPEKNYNTQMAYYTNGNSRVKYYHNSASEVVKWWLATPDKDNTIKYFKHINTSGSGYYALVTTTMGVSPVFIVG